MFLIITVTLSFGIIANAISSSCIASLCGGNAPDYIIPKYNITEIQVKSGDNLTLQCLPGDNSSTWIRPQLDRSRQRCDYSLEKYDEDTIENEQSLFIPKVTYAHTGLYVCTTSSGTVGYYVYVQDDSILSLTNTRIFSGDVIINQNFTATIPCIPTFLDVKVDLYLGNSTEAQTKVLDDWAVFNPQKGFTTNDTSSPGIRIYTCKFTRGKKEQVLTSRLIVTPENFSVPYILMSQIQNKGRIIVQCAYDGHENFIVEWITPQKKSDKRTHQFDFKESTTLFNQTISWFTVGGADKKDEGFYYCKITKNEQVFNINYINVKVQDFDLF